MCIYIYMYIYIILYIYYVCRKIVKPSEPQILGFDLSPKLSAQPRLLGDAKKAVPRHIWKKL